MSGILQKIKNTEKIFDTKNPKLLPEDNLDKKEITIILNLIKGTTFKGDSLETMYNLVMKLQSKYTNLK